MPEGASIFRCLLLSRAESAPSRTRRRVQCSPRGHRGPLVLGLATLGATNGGLRLATIKVSSAHPETRVEAVGVTRNIPPSGNNYPPFLFA